MWIWCIKNNSSNCQWSVMLHLPMCFLVASHLLPNPFPQGKKRRKICPLHHLIFQKWKWSRRASLIFPPNKEKEIIILSLDLLLAHAWLSMISMIVMDAENEIGGFNISATCFCLDSYVLFCVYSSRFWYKILQL